MVALLPYNTAEQQQHLDSTLAELGPIFGTRLPTTGLEKQQQQQQQQQQREGSKLVRPQQQVCWLLVQRKRTCICTHKCIYEGLAMSVYIHRI